MSSKQEIQKQDLINKNCLIYTNFIWVIAILVITLIIVLTLKVDKISDSSKIVNLIMNFATFLSIVLSIFSILFAYYTSRDTSQQYNAMNKALGEMRETNRSMENNNTQLLNRVNDITNRITSLDTKYQIDSIISNSVNRSNLSQPPHLTPDELSDNNISNS